jgi:leucyl aminopeptidase
LLAEAAEILPSEAVIEFQEKEKVKVNGNTYISPKECRRYVIEESCCVRFSKGVEELPYYSGLASGLLASAYSFNLKAGDQPPAITVALSASAKHPHSIISLASALVRSVILANGRGDYFGTPEYFVKRAKELEGELGLGVKVVSGAELLEEGLNLFHAVGRGSSKAPALINLSYRGIGSNEGWVALVGKGICFDSGGLDLKGSEHLQPMFLDKSGACSCLSAIEYIAREKLPINVTATLGMAENFISRSSYRPGDIIKSKKGLTVEIADTDAEGRLVLADCMTWTQLNYRVTRMVELSTLTYSIIVGLGHSMAGIFGNSHQFSQLLRTAGEQVL